MWLIKSKKIEFEFDHLVCFKLEKSKSITFKSSTIKLPIQPFQGLIIQLTKGSIFGAGPTAIVDKIVYYVPEKRYFSIEESILYGDDIDTKIQIKVVANYILAGFDYYESNGYQYELKSKLNILKAVLKEVNVSHSGEHPLCDGYPAIKRAILRLEDLIAQDN